MSWEDFSATDDSSHIISSLFSKTDLLLLSEKPPPPDIKDTKKVSLAHSLINETLQDYQNRPVDMDQLRLQLRTTNENLLRSKSQFLHYVKRPSTWLTVLIASSTTLGLMVCVFLVIRARKLNFQELIRPRRRIRVPQAPPRATAAEVELLESPQPQSSMANF